jgi:hypothetical protein
MRLRSPLRPVSVSRAAWRKWQMRNYGLLALSAVEVKPDDGYPKPEQEMVLKWLASHGVECYVWSQLGGSVWVKT